MNRPSLVAGPSQPTYSNEARIAKVEGTVLARCTITTSGSVTNCRIIKGLPFMDAPVLDALRQQRYTPVTFNGAPVQVDYLFTFKFKLQ
jgi:TonB family protein